MKLRHTQVVNPKTGEIFEELSHNWSLEEHIKNKLKHVSYCLSGGIKDLNVNNYDIEKYYNNRSLLDSVKIENVKSAISLQQKHADIKKLIKSVSKYIDTDEDYGHQMLDDISWSDFKKKFLWFFEVEY